MKKLAMVMAILVMVLTVASASADVIDREGIVVGIDWLDCTFKVLTYDGNVWVLELDDECYIGDVVLLAMDDNQTGEAEDDMVLRVWYLDSISEMETIEYIESFN